MNCCKYQRFLFVITALIFKRNSLIFFLDKRDSSAMNENEVSFEKNILAFDGAIITIFE